MFCQDGPDVSLLRSLKQNQQQSHEEHGTNFILNLELAQCVSKTNKALDDIVRHHAAITSENIKNKTTYLISIVMTNNSLLETGAWKSRAAKIAGKTFNITRIASNAVKGEFHSITNLSNAYTATAIGMLSHLTDPDNTIEPQLPADVIIMCNNDKRISDMNILIKSLTNISKILPIRFKFNIYFDEADKYLTPIMNFITSVHTNEDEFVKNAIKNIQFITATVKAKLITMLPDGCNRLLNLDYNLNVFPEDGEEVSTQLYKTILNQRHIPFEGPTQPISYVEEYMEQFKIDPTKIYFVPAETKVVSHNKMAKLFKDKGLHVLILNGKDKKIFSPTDKVSNFDLKRFIGKPKRDGNKNNEDPELQELRDILSTWRKEHPHEGLAITGCNVLERGLTFLTDGFCFDYMIISPYFSSVIKSREFLIQLLGRGQGKLEFVGEFDVIMPQALHDEAKEYIRRSEALIKEKVQYYTETHLKYLECKKTKKIDTFCLVYDDSNFDEGCLELYSLGYKINIKHWKKIREDVTDKGFIEYKFRGPKHVWSMSEVLRDVGGFSKDDEKDERRPYPCYESLDDKNSLKWVIRCKNTDRQIKLYENKLIIDKDKDDNPIFSKLIEKVIIE